MTVMIESADIAPCLLGLVIIVAMTALRWRASARFYNRMRQIRTVADLVRQHADYMEQFLAHEDAPSDVKAMLIAFSDAMSDEMAATTLAHRVIDSFSRSPAMSPEAVALAEAIEKLRVKRPGLAETFHRAVGTGMAGGFLRWTGAAGALELMAPQLLANRNEEFAAVAEGARLRNGIGFGFADAVPAA